jgi:ABC-2 type transport system permease protein
VKTTLVQIGQLGWRSVVRVFRQPGVIAFPLVFPLVLLAVLSSGLDPAKAIPGFPADSFLAFAMAIPFVQGALFVAINAGTDLSRDIESGFLNRLALTPVRDVALLLGQLSGAVALGVFQSLVYLSAGLIAGVDFKSGPGGILVLLLLAALVALAFASVGMFLAFRTGSTEAVQGLFPLLFVLLFLSSMNMPRNLIEKDWFQAIATVNPVTYLIEGIRSLIIEGWDSEALLLAFAVVGVALVLALVGAGASLRTRLTRT